MLVVTGAEYFYGGFFSLHPPFPDSRNWIWQVSFNIYVVGLLEKTAVHPYAFRAVTKFTPSLNIF